MASHWGGTRDLAIVHWPGVIKAKGEIRSHWAAAAHQGQPSVAFRQYGATQRELHRRAEKQVPRHHRADRVPNDGAQGVIMAQGGAFGGWSLYVKDGKPAYCYNRFALERFKI